MGQSFMQRMADRQQAPHLGQIIANRDIEAALAQLESLLLPRRDPLGEALSLVRRLHAAPRSHDTEALRERLQQTLAELDRVTLKLILRCSELLNCGLPSDVDPSQRFAFECPRIWETLSPTADPKVRHCADCQRSVYFEDSLAAVESRALAGQCVAMAAPLANGQFQSLTRAIVGRPNPRARWGMPSPGRNPGTARDSHKRRSARKWFSRWVSTVAAMADRGASAAHAPGSTCWLPTRQDQRRTH